MNQTEQAAWVPWRFYFVLICIVLAACGLLYRVIDLTLLTQAFLLKQGNGRMLRQVQTPIFRGIITDRNGFPLAVSARVYAVWMNPQTVDLTHPAFKTLAKLLKIAPAEIKRLAKQHQLKKRSFVYLKRGLSPQLAEKIKALQVPGIETQAAYKRFYPEGEVTSHLLGLTNVDDQGQEGIELAYNRWLSGVQGKQWVIKDRLGRTITAVQSGQPAVAGKALRLSIDRRIQYFAYRRLLEGVQKNNAAAGSAIVLDVKTGEILAMVNYPSFNPNDRPLKVDHRIRNRAVTDTFEPGSTIKAFSIASALDSGHFKMETVIDTSPGWMRVDKNVVRDNKNNGKLSVKQIMQRSSNVGVTKMILSLPPDQLWQLLHRVGFGEITGVGFPGEESGVLTAAPVRGGFTLATLAFGYGLTVTPLQLAKAYAVFANEGKKLPVTLLYQDKNKVLANQQVSEQVIEPGVAQAMLHLLEAVVSQEGTGRSARIRHYRVAGKTGTSKIAGIGGYQTRRYIASFVGIAPVTNPRLVVAVVIKDPQGGKYYANSVAAPVFKHIMQSSLRILSVPSDAVI